MAEGEAPKLVGQQFRKNVPLGEIRGELTASGKTFPIATGAESSTMIGNLTPNIITEIKEQKRSGNFRTAAGRPWWTSMYTSEELKKAGL